MIAAYSAPGSVPVEKIYSPEKTILLEMAYEKVKFQFC